MMCTIVRWQLSNRLDDATPAGRLARGHLARCSDCRAFAARLDALHGRLELGAARAAVPVPASGRRAVRPALWLGLAAASAAALLVFVFARPHHAAPAPAPQSAAAALVVPPHAASASQAQVGSALPASRAVARAADRLIDAAPLRRELSALESDTLRGAKATLHLTETGGS